MVPSRRFRRKRDVNIFEAAGRRGDELAQALAAGADPAGRDEGGRTPLHFAARVDAAHLQLLLDAGADPDARDARGLAPLHFAASVGGRTIATLLAAGAAVDPPDENGHTPLLHALHGAWLESASTLLVAGADPRHADHSGECGLDVLQPRLGSGLIDEMWRADAYLHGPDRLGEHLRSLIDQGLEGRLLMVLAPRLRTGFFSALAGIELPLASWRELADELEQHCTERGAWPELVTLHRCGLPVTLPAALGGVLQDPYEACQIPAGEAPFSLVGAALASGRAVPFVLRQAPESSAAANAALFALLPIGTWPTNDELEALRGRALRALVEVGAELDAPATAALEKVHQAMGLPGAGKGERVWDDERQLAARHPEVVSFLSVLASDRPELPPLLRAAWLGSPIVPLLLAAGAQRDIVDGTGRGALHLACLRGAGFMRSAEGVQCLLEAGVAVDAADHAGWRPLMLATDGAILAALLRAGARPELAAEERRLLGRAADRQQAAIAAARRPTS